MAGLVCKERDGQKICYQLKPDDELVQQLIALTTNEIKEHAK
jgi:DNA-binding transcriptional ArsR family regulator